MESCDQSRDFSPLVPAVVSATPNVSINNSSPEIWRCRAVMICFPKRAFFIRRHFLLSLNEP